MLLLLSPPTPDLVAWGSLLANVATTFAVVIAATVFFF